MDDQDYWLRYQVIHACLSAERVEIGGVVLDLAHPDLDRDTWKPTDTLGSPRVAGPHTPRLLFPWSTAREREIFDFRGEGWSSGPGIPSASPPYSG